jgi:tRNA (cytidine/uridine-2'-O-)-methyltransferase
MGTLMGEPVTTWTSPRVVLWEPEIAPNTGNIARLCAATGTELHLVGRLGFRIDDRSLRRAGCDYWEHVQVARHLDWAAFRHTFPNLRVVAVEVSGPWLYSDFRYRSDDVLVFGPESRGLPDWLLAEAAAVVRLPMPTGRVRSLNLANTVGIVLYEAMRQALTPQGGQNLGLE